MLRVEGAGVGPARGAWYITSGVPTTLVIASGNPHKVEEFRAILAPLGGTLAVMGLGEVAGGGAVHEPEETGSTFVENAAIKAISYCRQVGLPCLADDSGLEVDALGGRPGVISSHYFNDGRTDGVALGMARGERDRRNNERLLGELGRTGFEERSARFVCVLALAVPGEYPFTALEGRVRSAQEDVGLGCGRHARNPLVKEDRDPMESGASSPVGPRLLETFRGTFEGRIGFGAADAPRRGLVVPRGEHGFGYDPLFLVAPEFERTGAELRPEEKNATSHRAKAGAALLDWLAHPANLGLFTPGR